MARSFPQQRHAGARLVIAACFLASARAMPQFGGPDIDRVHKIMEPSHPVPKAPRLKNPAATGLRLVTPQNVLMVTPAALVALAFAAPDVLARILLQVVCFFGSLIEPFDPLLPQKGLLRTLVTTVKSAKRAWYIKQGLPDPGDTSFMDDDDDDDDDEVETSSSAKADDDADDEANDEAAEEEAATSGGGDAGDDDAIDDDDKIYD